MNQQSKPACDRVNHQPGPGCADCRDVEPEVYVVLRYPTGVMDVFAADVVENNLVTVTREIASYKDSSLPLWLMQFAKEIKGKRRRQK